MFTELLNLGRTVRGWLSGSKAARPVRKSNRAVSVDLDRYQETAGAGQNWARTVYGEYYATSERVP